MPALENFQMIAMCERTTASDCKEKPKIIEADTLI